MYRGDFERGDSGEKQKRNRKPARAPAGERSGRAVRVLYLKMVPVIISAYSALSSASTSSSVLPQLMTRRMTELRSSYGHQV